MIRSINMHVYSWKVYTASFIFYMKNRFINSFFEFLLYWNEFELFFILDDNIEAFLIVLNMWIKAIMDIVFWHAWHWCKIHMNVFYKQHYLQRVKKTMKYNKWHTNKIFELYSKSNSDFIFPYNTTIFKGKERLFLENIQIIYYLFNGLWGLTLCTIISFRF